MVNIINTDDGIIIKYDVDNIPGLKDLDGEQQKEIYKAALLDEIKDEAREHIRGFKIDQKISKYIDDWLVGKSPKTAEMYRAHIKAYLGHCNKQGVTFGTARPTHVRAWLTTITAHQSANTARTKMAALSSLYGWCVGEGVLRANPCANVAVPKRQYKKAVRPDHQLAGSSVPVMTAVEADKIIRWLEECDDVHAAIVNAVRLIHTHGLRVGAIPTLKRTRHGFSVTSKRKRQSFVAETVPDVKGVTVRMIQHAVKRATIALYNADKIRHPYTCHDFRHAFAVAHYKTHKDIVALRDALGHASINITDIYLQSIGCVFGYKIV